MTGNDVGGQADNPEAFWSSKWRPLPEQRFEASSTNRLCGFWFLLLALLLAFLLALFLGFLLVFLFGHCHLLSRTITLNNAWNSRRMPVLAVFLIVQPTA